MHITLHKFMFLRGAKVPPDSRKTSKNPNLSTTLRCKQWDKGQKLTTTYPSIGCQRPICGSLPQLAYSPWSFPDFILAWRCIAGLGSRLCSWRLWSRHERFHRRRWRGRRSRNRPIYWRRRRRRWRWWCWGRHLESVICCSLLQARDFLPRSCVARKFLAKGGDRFGRYKCCENFLL